jgi:hypothetical protein
MNKTKKARTVLSVILAFVLSLSLTVLSVAVVADTTVLSPEYTAKMLQKCGFGEALRDDLYTEFLSYGNACNIGDNFFDKFFNDTLSADFINSDAVTYVVEVYYDSKAAVDTARIEQALKPALYDYAIEMGYGDQPNLDEDLNLIVSELSSIYKAHIELPAVSTLNKMIMRANKLINIAIAAISAFILLCAVVILFSYKPKIEPFMYLTCSCAGAFLMTLVLPLYLRVTNIIGKVNITGKALYSFVVTYVNGVLNAVLISSAVMALLTLIFAVLFAIRVRKN